jgi:hypothetical protein
MAVTEPVHLITGWEPEVPVTDTLLRQFVHALADSLAGPHPGAWWPRGA